MLISEFCEKYKAKKFMNTPQGVAERSEWIRSELEIKHYVPFAEKVHVAQTTIDISVEYDRGFVKFDSCKKHLSFTFAAIETHTNLRFADGWSNKIADYDMLCASELIDPIIDAFKCDYDASLSVLDMMCGDMLANNSVESSVAKVAQSISENLDVFVGALSDKLENLDIEKIIPNNLDLDKLQLLLSKVK